MVDWFAGKRMKGTSSERTSLSTTALGGTGVGGWVELGRTTLGSPATTIDVSSLANKRYLMVLYNNIDNGTNTHILVNQYGNSSVDTGSNYSERRSSNGGADVTGTSQTYINTGSGDHVVPEFTVQYIANYASKEKLIMSHSVGAQADGAPTAPNRRESVGKWTNTSNPIDVIRANTAFGSRSYGTGSEVVVLGYDPADTHSSNFWQELGTADVSGGTIDISFTAKKYLWLQCYAVNSGSGGDHLNLRLGNTSIDSGTNYAMRYSIDGATDATLNPQNDINLFMSPTSNEKIFVNVFIINNASQEKLMIIHGVSDNALTGASNAPARFECVAKWANTSNQANILQLFNQGAGTLTGNSTARIWGAD